jgi:hypothetical protein
MEPEQDISISAFVAECVQSMIPQILPHQRLPKVVSTKLNKKYPGLVWSENITLRIDGGTIVTYPECFLVDEDKMTRTISKNLNEDDGDIILERLWLSVCSLFRQYYREHAQLSNLKLVREEEVFPWLEEYHPGLLYCCEQQIIDWRQEISGLKLDSSIDSLLIGSITTTLVMDHTKYMEGSEIAQTLKLTRWATAPYLRLLKSRPTCH